MMVKLIPCVVFQAGKQPLVVLSLLASLLLTVTACAQSSEQAASPPSSQPAPATPSRVTSPTPDLASPGSASADTTAVSNVISAEGIGAARLGIPLGELKQRLGSTTEFQVQSPFMVDFDAIAVLESGEIQYYILYIAGQPLSDRDVIQGLLVDNPKFKTAEGVGAGSSLREAEAVYGNATLSYSLENEGREYARFERQPPNLSFSTGNANTQTAGIYPSPTQTYNETETFRENATIQSILIVCLSENCANP